MGADDGFVVRLARVDRSVFYIKRYRAEPSSKKLICNSYVSPTHATLDTGHGTATYMGDLTFFVMLFDQSDF
jgi:hypothetical protein